MEKTERDVWVTKMKGFAILGIVVYHWFAYFTSGVAAQVAKLGSRGIHVFFILSAFGLFLSLQKLDKIDWIGWYQKRFLKLLVPFYLSFAVVFLSIALFSLLGPSYNEILSRAFRAILPTLLLYRGLLKDQILAINSTWWFVTTLLQLYVLFPVFFLAYRKHRTGLLMAALIINLAWEGICAMAASASPWALERFSLRYLFEYCLGFYLADLFAHDPKKFHDLLFGIKPFVLGLVLQVIAATFRWEGANGKNYNGIPMGLGFFLISANIVFYLTSAYWIDRALRWLGEYSFSIFLLHLPYIALFFAPFRHFGLSIALTGFPIYMVFVCLQAWAFHHFFLQRIPLIKKYF